MPDGFGGEKTSFGAAALPVVMTVGVITFMVLCAEWLGEKEIIFPEIAAISIGYLLAPRRAWMTSSWRIFLLISICAWIGLGIVRFVPLPRYWQILLAFVLSQVIYACSGTSFAPLVSALVLPVLLQTTSLVYPISASLLTILVILLHLLLEKTGLRPKEAFSPLPGLLHSSAPQKERAFLAIAKRVLCVALLALVAQRLQLPYLVAPPLLVAFTEFSNPEGKARKKPVSAILLITMCALAGASCRSVLTVRFGLPLSVAALACAILLILILSVFDLYLPPAGAAGLLALLIPEDALLLYPVEIILGVSILMGASMLLFARKA